MKTRGNNMRLPTPQNETADIGFFRNIGFAFILLTAIAGSMTVGLILKQNDASAPITIAGDLAQPVVAKLAE
jgi:hypothetical protein